MRNVVYKARHWRKHAADLHTLASNKRYADIEDAILRIAESYEKTEDARRRQAAVYLAKTRAPALLKREAMTGSLGR